MKYLVVGSKSWNRLSFQSAFHELSSEWTFCSTAKDLARNVNSNRSIRYAFFLHWSEKIPKSVINKCECVCFHMTDVPFGRGGSPLQNLIARGLRDTKLTALRMTHEFDAGPVYLKRALSLEGASAEEILIRASDLSCKMAMKIAKEEMEPTPQTGQPTVFKRRKPHQSELTSELSDLRSVFDHIRMLDAEGYPKAFVDIGDFRLEFDRASLYSDAVRANVTIRPRPREPKSRQ